jgi:hypothetical protein
MAHTDDSIWRDRDGIAFEELGYIYLETVTSKVVGKELGDLLMSLVERRRWDNGHGYSGIRGFRCRRCLSSR